MAKIYAVRAASPAIDTPHFAERPLKELLDQLRVSRSENWSESGPVTSAGLQPADAGGPACVQIEVAGKEGRRTGLEGRLASGASEPGGGQETPRTGFPVTRVHHDNNYLNPRKLADSW